MWERGHRTLHNFLDKPLTSLLDKCWEETDKTFHVLSLAHSFAWLPETFVSRRGTGRTREGERRSNEGILNMHEGK